MAARVSFRFFLLSRRLGLRRLASVGRIRPLGPFFAPLEAPFAGRVLLFPFRPRARSWAVSYTHLGPCHPLRRGAGVCHARRTAGLCRGPRRQQCGRFRECRQRGFFGNRGGDRPTAGIAQHADVRTGQLRDAGRRHPHGVCGHRGNGLFVSGPVSYTHLLVQSQSEAPGTSVQRGTIVTITCG